MKNIEAYFTLELLAGDEANIYCVGEFICSASAATDSYGRPTECDTPENWDILEFEINGRQFAISDTVAARFLKYDHKLKIERPMTAAELEAACIDALIFARDFQYSELPF